MKLYRWTALLLLSGCCVTPQYEQPCINVPNEWNCETTQELQTEHSPDCIRWWESLNDPMLDSLLERAALQNFDMSIAAMRVLQARESEKAGLANLLPHIDATASFAHLEYKKRILNRILGRGHHRHSTVDFFEIGFDAEWEIDLFGKNAHEMRAMKARMESSEEEFRNIWITLSGEIAKNYIELRGLQQRLAILNKDINAQEEMLRLNKDLLQAGFASDINQSQAEGQLYTLLAQKPQIELLINKAVYRLSVLLGYHPNELFAELCEFKTLPCLPNYRPIGVPSELLRRRPDIRKAERDLAAATEQVGSAIAALFPRISLRGFIGDIGTVCSGGGLAWLVTPQLLLPIFNSKSLQQDVTLNKLQAEEALYVYQKTVLHALEESENAIAAFHYELERYQYLFKAKKAAENAYASTFQLYKQGFKDYTEVLAINRSEITAENALLESQIELLIQYISIYKSLGGGWDIDDVQCE